VKPRRRVLAALALLVAMPVPAQTGRTARIAILDDAPEHVRAHPWALFRARLAELGWTEGKNLAVDARSAGGDLSRLDALAADIVAQQPDVIVVVSTTVALAAKKATSQIPIVALGPADPVKSGLVASLARPGGNLTGAGQNQAEIAGKWLDLLREVAPAAKSVAYLTDRGNPGEMLVFREIEDRARTRGMAMTALDGVGAGSVEQAFATIAAMRIDALIVATTAAVLPQRAQIVEAAARARIPAVYARKEYAEAGGLVSYGTDFNPVFERGADYVSRILRGAKPADLPFEMAATFKLVVNLRAARAQGIAIPQAVRVRADQVIE
jgi:putative ABC transport system substrate-binding protein